MKPSTISGTGGGLLFLTWLWNDLLFWVLGDFPMDKFPTLSVDAAAGLLLLIGAVLTRVLDKGEE